MRKGAGGKGVSAAGSGKAISVSGELDVITLGLKGALALAEKAEMEGGGSALTVASIGGVLSLMVGCVTLLGRCVRGEIDPAVLLSPQNTVTDDGGQEENDVHLHAWGPDGRNGAVAPRREGS